MRHQSQILTSGGTVRSVFSKTLQYFSIVLLELKSNRMRNCITFSTILVLGISPTFAKTCGEQSTEELRGNICSLELLFLST